MKPEVATADTVDDTPSEQSDRLSLETEHRRKAPGVPDWSEQLDTETGLR